MKLCKVMAGLYLLLWLGGAAAADDLKQGFSTPPDSARPGVYWYFMDGNLDRAGMTADLEAMKAAGMGNLVFLEVNVGVPRGPVDFLSEPWQDLFAHAVREAERLGIEITLGSGPGWTGSGGPWVKIEQSMQHLVASSVEVKGPSTFRGPLPVPAARKPFFDTLTPELERERAAFYEDVAVLAFPTPAADQKVADIDEKALYYRSPYSSAEGVKPYLPAPARRREAPPDAVIATKQIIDLTARLQPDGTLDWQAPAGNWTIMRFGRRNNGANTRPAPLPGLGFECDKFDAAALDAHFAEYVGKLLGKAGPRRQGAGWTTLHIDSWEMGAQNWSPKFREEFQRRRGYDPLPFYPAYTGRIVGSLEQTERFLWDLRQTGQELVVENHATRLKELGRRHGFALSIEPYDMNPTADLVLGSVADVPMCEFWSQGLGFDTSFSCIEAASIAHTMGRPVVAAEAFTALPAEAMRQYPGSMKNQGDWAFTQGVNRFVYHTFAHQPLGDEVPGMTMGPYGVHWHRNQTWWPMVAAYHRYISRNSFVLRQGTAVADILYLTPEGAPHVFRPPPSALTESDPIPDHKGYNFDGVAPATLLAHAEVREGQIVFPGGTSYRLLVLPAFDTMTPAVLEGIGGLVEQGATVIGAPPVQSPSLAGYPECDRQVRALAETLWGGGEPPAAVTERKHGKGRIFWGGELTARSEGELYPPYSATAALLGQMGVPEDFVSSGPVRYVHRRTADRDLYFVSNRAAERVEANCTFRVGPGAPELWDPLTGEIRGLPEFRREDGRTVVPMRFEAYQSYFVVFSRKEAPQAAPARGGRNFPAFQPAGELEGSWRVAFHGQRGGPGEVTFGRLEDWTARPEPGIKYYSGIATYRKDFDLPQSLLPAGKQKLYLDLGKVEVMARVRLNGQDLGVVWTAPWRVEISGAVKAENNRLEVEVANLWANRLIGDRQPADEYARDVQWPSGLLGGQKFKTGRHTFITWEYYKQDSPVQPSGLLGPVRLLSAAGLE